MNSIKNKLNNRAFTLVELLATIAILAILMLIAVPVIDDVIDSSRNKAFEATVRNIENATEKYVLDEEIFVENTMTIDLETLLNAGYIDKIPSDLTETDVVEITNDGTGNYEYNLVIEEE